MDADQDALEAARDRCTICGGEHHVSECEHEDRCPVCGSDEPRPMHDVLGHVPPLFRDSE